jgi:hypothetical protein
MKKYFISICGKLFIPFCAVMIAYCIFSQSIANLPYVQIIRYIIFGLALLLCISWIIWLFEPTNKRGKVDIKDKNIRDILYLYSWNIITYSFSIYFFIYLVFRLDKVSVIYNYLILFLFGIFLGYKLARKAYDYLKTNQEK